jgi:UDP:flavonoid glycosyltransferase YjiC (YdhE family)
VRPRVLFACWPFEGHVFPQLSIATALRDRGDQVAFYTAATAQETIESEGIGVFPFRRVQPAWLRVHERERAVGGRRQSLRVLRATREWLVETIPDQVADLRAVCERWQPDVLVSDASMWGPIVILREAASIPVALASPIICASIPGPDAPPPGSGMAPPRSARDRALAWVVARVTDAAARGMRRRLDELRAGYGLGPMGCSLNEFCGRLPLYLVASIPELDLERRDLPPSVRYAGPLLWHPPEPPGTTEWLDQLPADRPWVHVTEGTSHYQVPFVLRAAARGLAGAPVEAILTTGHARDPQELSLRPAAPNVHVTRWLSHDELLPRCRAVVTTGGAGTVMAALRAGAPLVVVPTTWDKPDNARRVTEAGVGLRLAPRRCTPEGLRAAVEQVVRDPCYRANAQRIAERLAAAPGPLGAAEWIEALAPVAGGTPQVAVARADDLGVAVASERRPT